MTTSRNSIEIDRFGERIQWMASHLQQCGSTKIKQHITTTAKVYDAIIALDFTIGTKRTWERYIAGGHPIPRIVIKALLTLFPEADEELLTCNPYSAFESRATPLTVAYARWKTAIMYMAKERHLLARFAKKLYANIDADPNSPLVVHRDWILPNPIEMTPTTPNAKFKRGTPAPRTTNLDETNTDYVTLKARLSPKPPFNGDCYRLMNVRRMENTLDFAFQDTLYFDYVNTCEILGVELADNYLKSASNAAPHPSVNYIPCMNDLSRRNRVSNIFDFTNRAAFVGVNCLLMLRGYSRITNGQKSDKFVIHQRTDQTLEAQNTLHVVPAGGHQPCEEAFGNKDDISFWRTAVREFCEELFNKQEATQITNDGSDLLERRDVQGQLKAFIFSGAARFYMLGIGIDPLTTKPELLVAIVIDWPMAQRLGGKETLLIEPNYEGAATLIDLDRKELKEILDYPPKGIPWLPAGRACIELALKHYDFLMKETK